MRQTHSLHPVSGGGFRSFSPALQRFMVATVVNMVGSSALFAFVMVYFHEVRDIPLAQAGLAVGAGSFAVVLLTPVAGWMSDRFGARRIMTAGCIVSIAAGATYAVVTSFPTAIAASVATGVGNALWFPSQTALLSLVVSPSERPKVMGWQRAALNVGAALGGVVGGLLVRAETLSSFQLLFGVNVATYVLFLMVIPGLPTGRVDIDRSGGRPPGYRAVLRDGFFVRLLFTDIAIALGFGFLWAFMPAYASSLGIDKVSIGVLFAFGAASVAITQIPTLRWVRGGGRMRWLMAMDAWFVLAFALMLITPHVAAGIAVLLIGVAQVCGGFGESVLGAVRQPLTADLAPPELVGRYYGLAGMMFQVCMGAATATGGALLQWSPSVVWLLPLLASLAGVVGLYVIRHRIPAHAALSA